MNLAFLCLYGMRKSLVFFLLVIIGSIVACDDDSNLDNEIVEILEPVDDLERLEQIIIEDENAVITQTIDISYDVNLLLTEINFSGNSNAIYTMGYAANNRLTAIEKQENGQMTNSTLTYLNNTITVRTTFPDDRVEEKELGIDFQNRINSVVIYNVDNGSRAAVDQLEYIYTQNFNVPRINNLSADGRTVESTTDFTYFFNNNPFKDMNDVIRFLIFPEFVPYTRYLPSTQSDQERVNGPISETKSVQYEYILQEDNFPSSRTVETTTAVGSQITVESFIYR